MGRKIGAFVVGYIAMAVFVFFTFSICYMILGTEGSFKPNSYQVSGIWLVLSLVLGFAAAVLGGWVCTMIAKEAKTAKVLAGFVLVLGLILAFVGMSGEDPATTMREGEVGNFEAMSVAKQPNWFLFVNPILGAAGILLGARLRKTEN